jgi:NADH dehydrogenase
MKQGDCVGRNIARSIKGKPVKGFGFRGMGQAAGLAGQRGITELYRMQFTGHLAWLIRILFFAWYMPSRRNGFAIVSQLGGRWWHAATGSALSGARVSNNPVAEAQGRIANLGG